MNVPVVAKSSAAWLAVSCLIAACSLVPVARPADAPTTNSERPHSVANATGPAAQVAGQSSVAARRSRPPDGVLASGSESVAGQLGSFCYRNFCADIGRWPSKSGLPRLAASNRSLRFTLGKGEEFVRWIARYAETSSDESSERLGQGGESFDPDADPSATERFTEVTFDAPPAGDWVVFLNLELAGGDLSYAWHVTVMPDTSTGG